MNCPRCGIPTEPYIARWNEGGISHLEVRPLCRSCEIVEWHDRREQQAIDRIRDAVIEATKETQQRKDG